jgi:DNA-binding transcriptional LysR family regulator
MTQPPLSRAIQRLERDLGVALLERGARGVALTPAGAAFFAEARRILVATEGARETARRVADGAAGTLALGFTALTAVSILPDLLREVDAHLDAVDLALHELVSSAQFDALLSGEIDLGLVRSQPDSPRMSTRLIHQERLVVAVPAGSPLASGSEFLPRAALDNADMIDFRRDEASSLADLAASVLSSVRVRSRQRVTQIHTMLTLVGAGRGIAVVPESAGAFDMHGVVLRRVAEWQAPVVEIRAAWDPENPRAALHRALALLPRLQSLDTQGVSANT